MRLLLPAFALALALLLPDPSRAGAWTLPPGDGLAIFTLTHSRADRFFDGAGGLTSGADFAKTEASLYLEYGLAEGLTLLAQSTLAAKQVDGPVPDERAGLDYSELGLRLRLGRWNDYVFSAQASGRVPGASAPASPAEIGSTDPEVDLRLLAGRGFALGTSSGYVDLQLAYRLRLDDPPNEIRLDATFGWRPRPRWLALAQVFGTFADGSARGVFTDARFAKLQLSAAYELTERWTVQAGAFATPWGRDAAQENGVFASVWTAF